MKAGFEVQCRRHDRSQIELRLSHFVGANGDSGNTKVDLYFFVPYSLGEASKLFDKEDFYREITNYFFFNTPRIGATEAELIASVKLTLDNLEAHRSAQLRRLAIWQIKLFTHMIKRRLKKISRWTPDPERGIQSRHSLMKQCKGLFNVLSEFRRDLVSPILQPKIDNDLAVKTAILNADEYLSMRIENLFTRKLAAISVDPEFSELRSYLHDMLSKESIYRRAMSSEFFVPTAQATDIEHYLYRSSLLKKFINQLLYIKQERSSRGKLYRNLVASFAAALAASWNTMLNLSSYRNVSGKDFGFSMIAIIAFGVGVYVTKDRIKDISKEYFNQKLKKYLPDYRVNMSYIAAPNDKKITIGHYDEVLRYLNRDSVPQEVAFLRDFKPRRDTSIKMEESVLLYSKQMEIDFRAMKVVFPEVRKIEEVLRFNLGNFLKNLSDPWKALSIFELDKGPLELKAPRVYHLNMILHLRDTTSQLAHYRVILDKNGIKRIESATGQQPLVC